MKVLILAAGLGKRLGLEDTPKPMYKILGKPILEHNLLLLKKHGMTDICITLHHKGDIIKDYFNDGSNWGVKIQYSSEKDLLGTAGALINAKWFLSKESFFVIYGDNYTDINLKEMLDFHLIHKPISTIGLFDPKKSLNSGIAGGKVLLDKDNNLLSFIEGKGDEINGYVNAGVYILEPQILELIPQNPPTDFGKDIFPALLKKRFKLKGYITHSFVLAIDTMEALKVAEEALTKKAINDYYKNTI